MGKSFEEGPGLSFFLFLSFFFSLACVNTVSAEPVPS